MLIVNIRIWDTIIQNICFNYICDKYYKKLLGILNLKKLTENQSAAGRESALFNAIILKIMAKTKKGKKIVSVHPYPRTKSDGSITVVKGHRRSTPCKCKHKR